MRVIMLDENGRYITIGNKTVHMRGQVSEMVKLQYSGSLMAILGIAEEDIDTIMEKLEKEVILSGLTDDAIMPGGYRHAATGKCLGGNTGGVVGNKLATFLQNFDIPVPSSKA